LQKEETSRREAIAVHKDQMKEIWSIEEELQNRVKELESREEEYKLECRSLSVV